MRLARCVVEEADRWAAERFGVSRTTSAQWAARTAAIGAPDLWSAARHLPGRGRFYPGPPGRSITEMGPICEHCQCRILGHGVEAGRRRYCRALRPPRRPEQRRSGHRPRLTRPVPTRKATRVTSLRIHHGPSDAA
ncbi:hypothetical protein Arub01_26280 [Actinomadura rubrobrunea]|uniref:Uncharacterized protein n=1 Tax=Actinomadura rubrobrunea TaxID=115335 RepID=A0A9W6UUW9_9ACTN|nr:hypothetical protein Arub01_26280 [Actinomadura rubrobrunea]